MFAAHCFTPSRARRPASVIRTARNLVLAPTSDDALGGRRSEPGADKLYHVADRECADAVELGRVLARATRHGRAAMTCPGMAPHRLEAYKVLLYKAL